MSRKEETVSNNIRTNSEMKEASSLKKALIIGINGQIGSYLCDILHTKNYCIYGVVRCLPADKLSYVTYFECDINDITKLKTVISSIVPDEIYNMAAQSDAVRSVLEPESTLWTNANVVVALCEIIRKIKNESNRCIKLFQAGSVEIFRGLNIGEERIDESVLTFYPKNPYAIAKLTAYWMIRYYREQHQCYMCNGIIFNAESPRRSEKFVTRKIASGVKQALKDPNYILTIGNLDAQRDWIHAYDVAMAAWLILQQGTPDDFMIGLGSNHSVRTFVEKSFAQVNIKIIWTGARGSTNELGYDYDTGRVLITIDPAFFREYETKTTPLLGNVNKLRSIGWRPVHSLDTIITELLNA